MIEENEIPDVHPIHGGIEHDLLAQRRARRAELSDPALIRRAEAAEATVRTLETHLSTLQQRMDETSSEQLHIAEQLAEREREVRRVKQREYAEQQLRVEAEDRCDRTIREKRTEVEELHRNLSISERRARELTEQLEQVRRDLAEAQQAVAAERVAAGRNDHELTERETEMHRRETALEQTRSELERRLAAARDFESRARDLRVEAEERREELSARLAELERRAVEVQQELDTQRDVRKRTEAKFAAAQRSYSALRDIIVELGRAVASLRGAIDNERSTLRQELDAQRIQLQAEHATELEQLRSELTREHAGELHRNAEQTVELERRREQMEGEHKTTLQQLQTRITELEGELEQTAAELHRHEALTDVSPAVLAPQDESHPESSESQRRREMTEALAAAVERLRARVAAPEDEPAGSEQTEADSTALSTVSAGRSPQPDAVAEASRPSIFERPLSLPANPGPWLAAAIRAVAQKRDARLAGELVIELLPAQRLLLDHPLTYAVEIQELGSFTVYLDGERTRVQKLTAPTGEKVDFLLKGSAADFSELAAGGAGRRLGPLKARGSKRRARRLLATRKAPLMLSDLAAAGMSVWPGLLLLAMAEAIDPQWTRGERFALAFEIQNDPVVTIFMVVNDGAPIAVTRVLPEQPAATVRLSEFALLCLLAGVAIPAEERPTVDGEMSQLERLVSWTDRVQGLIVTG